MKVIRASKPPAIQPEDASASIGFSRVNKQSPPPGLVPQSGDWSHPKHWVLPEESNAGRIVPEALVSAYQEWARELTSAQTDAIEKWQVGDHESVNFPLIEQALSAAKTPHAMQVYRYGDIPDDLEVGGTFTEEGFMATSTSRGWVKDMQDEMDYAPSDHLVIELPQGAPAAYLEAAGIESPESEMLIQRGSQFRYIGQTPEGNAHLELINLTLNKAAPGPPPRPGLAWKEETHRWIRPEGLESPQDAVPSSTSSTSSTTTFSPKVQPEVFEKIDAMFPGLDSKALIADAYSVGVPGYSVNIGFVSVTKDGAVAIEMDLMLEDEPVGDLVRHISKNKQGQLAAYHTSFYINEDHQGEGVASDMLDRAEAAYQNHGIKEIRLNADDEVGGYAWARQGFEFATAADRRDLDSEAEYSIRAYGANNGLDRDQVDALIDEYHTLEHPWDIAAWNPTNAKPGEHLGKGILLGSDWNGKKSLNPDSASYKVGRMYREARRAHAR